MLRTRYKPEEIVTKLRQVHGPSDCRYDLTADLGSTSEPFWAATLSVSCSLVS